MVSNANSARIFQTAPKYCTRLFGRIAPKNTHLLCRYFLAQADGICKEITGTQLFRRVGERTALADVVDATNVDELTAALLTPLLTVYPVAFSEGERRGMNDILNRHAILHGESTSYGTLTNSSKAMSLLAFTAWVVSDLKQFAREQAERTDTSADSHPNNAR